MCESAVPAAPFVFLRWQPMSSKYGRCLCGLSAHTRPNFLCRLHTIQTRNQFEVLKEEAVEKKEQVSCTTTTPHTHTHTHTHTRARDVFIVTTHRRRAHPTSVLAAHVLSSVCIIIFNILMFFECQLGRELECSRSLATLHLIACVLSSCLDESSTKSTCPGCSRARCDGEKIGETRR
jgi:hypothetical protein